MSLLFRERDIERRDQMTDTFAAMRAARLSGSWAGVPVTPDSVLTVPAVWACEQLTAGIISQLPFDEYRHTRSDDGRVELEPSPLIANPSADVSPEDWRFQAVESAQLHGCAYGPIVSRDALGYPTQVELVHPSRVQARIHPQSRVVEWKLDGTMIPGEDLWRMPGRPSVGSPLGLPLVSYMAEVAGLGMAARRYGSTHFRHGSAPPVLIQPAGDPGADGAKGLKEKIANMLLTGEAAVIADTIKVNKWPGMTPAEAQLVEFLRANATDVATFYIVPPELVGGLVGDSMTYSNVEARLLNLLALGVSYWLTKLEKALSRSLPRGRFVKANEAAIIRTDTKTRIEVMGAELRSGLLLQNEGRALLDRPPIDGGDERYVWPPFTTSPTPTTPAQ